MSKIRDLRTRAKAAAYAVIMRLGLEKFIVWVWRMKGQDTRYLEGPDLAARFDRIYADKVWMGETDTNISGSGSSMEATAQLIEGLPRLLDSLGAKSILDLGCGNYFWMQHVPLQQEYIGVDIVPGVIEDNRRSFADDRHRFEVLNGCADPLPAVDVVLCREIMFHLSFQDAQSLLANVRRSAAKYLICTTDPTIPWNVDVPSGGWRDINLQAKPYSLGATIATLADGVPTNANRMLGVWKLDPKP